MPTPFWTKTVTHGAATPFAPAGKGTDSFPLPIPAGAEFDSIELLARASLGRARIQSQPAPGSTGQPQVVVDWIHPRGLTIRYTLRAYARDRATHAKCYAHLRSSLLARQFALGRFWRANHFAVATDLGDWHAQSRARFRQEQPGIGQPVYGWKYVVREAAEFGLPGGERWGLPEKPQAPGVPTPPEYRYQDGPTLNQLDPDSRLIERWRVMRHDRSNSLLWSGLRLVSLCVEHELGNPNAAAIILLVLRTLDSLYKFRDDTRGFGGYILRWDPASSDNWTVAVDDKGRETPLSPCEFLLNPDPTLFDKESKRYLYCTPFSDPQYVRAKQEKVGDKRGDMSDYRRWEPSMDEYTGLISGYHYVWQTFKNAQAEPGLTIKNLVYRHILAIAKYFSTVGYILVRPRGGFVFNGAAGVLPALEYPFRRVFREILSAVDNAALPPTASWDDAMRLAGVLGELRQYSMRDRAQAWQAFLSDPVWAQVRTQLGWPPGQPPPKPRQLLRALTGTNGGALTEDQGNQLFLGFLSLVQNWNVFEVPKSQQLEFVIGYGAKWVARVSPESAFETFMDGRIRIPFRDQIQLGGCSADFKPMIGLTALTEPMLAGNKPGVVRAAYLNWFDANVAGAAPSRNELEDEHDASRAPGISALATAVALLLRRGTREESRLNEELEDMRRAIATTYAGELRLKGSAPNFVSEIADRSGNGFGYLLPLSLAWRYQKDQQTTAVTGEAVPTPAEVQAWKARVPGKVLRAVETATIINFPVAAVARGYSIPTGTNPPDVDVLANPPPKPADNQCGAPRPPVDAGWVQQELRWDGKALDPFTGNAPIETDLALPDNAQGPLASQFPPAQWECVLIEDSREILEHEHAELPPTLLGLAGGKYRLRVWPQTYSVPVPDGRAQLWRRKGRLKIRWRAGWRSRL